MRGSVDLCLCWLHLACKRALLILKEVKSLCKQACSKTNIAPKVNEGNKIVDTFHKHLIAHLDIDILSFGNKRMVCLLGIQDIHVT